jgi:CubicO group peptidase (beta-lactamase class C family)
MSPSRLLSFLFLALVAVTPGAFAQLTVGAAPESVGVSAARLDRYEAFLQQEIAAGRIAGAVSLVARRGEVVHRAALGYSSLQDEAPMREDQIFQLMSMTKPIVSVAFMMLYEEGHFLLDEPVAKYLPEFADLRVATNDSTGIAVATVSADRPVTIAQVLSHTAGFSHGLGGTQLDNEIARQLYGQPHAEIAARVATLAELPLVGQPGEQWYYSASPDILARLIEHFSGQSVIEFLRERLFDPLGMDDTRYNLSPAQQPRVVAVHNQNEAGELVNSPRQLPVSGISIYGGTHGLLSTADDYYKFCRMLLNGGSWDGRQYLSPKTVELMTMNHLGELEREPGEGFGLGFGVTIDVAATRQPGSIGQYYWSGAYSTYFFVDPQEELIAILMLQLQPYSEYYSKKFRQMVYQTLVDSAVADGK